MYTCVRGIDCFSVSMISFIIIIINVHVPDQYSDTSDTCIHDRSLYWSGTCTLIIIIMKDIIETEKQYIPLTHVYMTLHCTGLSLFLWYLLLLLLLMYMYQTSTVNGHVYMCHRYRLFLCFTSDTCIHDRSLYWSGTCTLIIIIIMNDIIETETQSIPLTHVYMTVHCTGLVHVH
jgi:hypothetical protein